MREYHATLNLIYDARDREEAAEIAEICARAIREYQRQPYKVEVETDDLEEA